MNMHSSMNDKLHDTRASKIHMSRVIKKQCFFWRMMIKGAVLLQTLNIISN